MQIQNLQPCLWDKLINRYLLVMCGEDWGARSFPNFFLFLLSKHADLQPEILPVVDVTPFTLWGNETLCKPYAACVFVGHHCAKKGCFSRPWRQGKNNDSPNFQFWECNKTPEGQVQKWHEKVMKGCRISWLNHSNISGRCTSSRGPGPVEPSRIVSSSRCSLSRTVQKKSPMHQVARPSSHLHHLHDL